MISLRRCQASSGSTGNSGIEPQDAGGKKASHGSFSRRDHFLILALTVLYAFIAFCNLGSTEAPQSFLKFSEEISGAQFELSEPVSLSCAGWYSGIGTGSITLWGSENGSDWQNLGTAVQSYDILLRRNELTLASTTVPMRYYLLTGESGIWVGELKLYDKSGELINADRITRGINSAPLFDEQDAMPETYTYYNGSYFDEIYHARTALEYIKGVTPYETTHPPLGKIIIAAGMLLWGVNPFGWRFSGTLFGILMLPLMYDLLKRLCHRTDAAICFTAVFALDFMHFTQTRIATIDTYAVFFILAMYDCFYRYISAEEPRCREKWLAASGICFGLGAASKWTCIYAGAGLGVMWVFGHAKRLFSREPDAVGRFWRETALCVGFFVAVPLLIYTASYFPFTTAYDVKFFSGDYFKLVWQNQVSMLTYHSGITATHPYSSRWYEWVLNLRPILYYLNYSGSGRSTIAAFTGPIVCWGGLLAMCVLTVCCLYRFRSDFSKRFWFVLVGYLAQLLPWVFVTRITFAYHYFPCGVFLTLALGLGCTAPIEGVSRQSQRRLMLAIVACSILLFVFFYPVISGTTAENSYFSFLHWLPRWPL